MGYTQFFKNMQKHNPNDHPHKKETHISDQKPETSKKQGVLNKIETIIKRDLPKDNIIIKTDGKSAIDKVESQDTMNTHKETEPSNVSQTCPDGDICSEIFQQEVYYGFLLDETFELATVFVGADTESVSEKLVQKWEKVLDVECCPLLRREFIRIKAVSQESVKNIDFNFYILSRWIGFLYSLGVLCYACPNTILTISPQNRQMFLNGKEFADNCQCIVENSPWLVNGNMLRRGMLKTETKEE